MQNKHPYKLDFEQYIRNTGPAKKEKSYAWATAIGLQQVDGLTPSKYLIERIGADKNGLWKISLPREGSPSPSTVCLNIEMFVLHEWQRLTFHYNNSTSYVILEQWSLV